MKLSVITDLSLNQICFPLEKMPSIRDRGQTDRVTILANPNPMTVTPVLDFQFLASYSRDYIRAKSRSTARRFESYSGITRTDTTDFITFLGNAVADYFFSLQTLQLNAKSSRSRPGPVSRFVRRFPNTIGLLYESNWMPTRSIERRSVQGPGPVMPLGFAIGADQRRPTWNERSPGAPPGTRQFPLPDIFPFHLDICPPRKSPSRTSGPSLG